MEEGRAASLICRLLLFDYQLMKMRRHILRLHFTQTATVPLEPEALRAGGGPRQGAPNESEKYYIR